MRVEIGEIEIIAEHVERRTSGLREGDDDLSEVIEGLRRELGQYVETLVREEFRRRTER